MEPHYYVHLREYLLVSRIPMCPQYTEVFILWGVYNRQVSHKRGLHCILSYPMLVLIGTFGLWLDSVIFDSICSLHNLSTYIPVVFWNFIYSRINFIPLHKCDNYTEIVFDFILRFRTSDFILQIVLIVA